MKDWIRVGVLLDACELPAWQFAVLESIARSDIAALVLAIQGGTAASDHGPRNARAPRTVGLLDAVRRLEARRKRPLPDACEPRPVGGLPVCSGTHLPKSSEIDVLLVFSDRATASGGLPSARLGHWYFTSGGKPFAPPDGTRVGLVEYIRRLAVLETTLEAIDPETGIRRTAYTTFSAIDYGSHYVTRNEHLWKCSAMVLRALRDCRAAGTANYLASLAVRTGTERGDDGSIRLLPVLATLLLKRFWKKAYRALFAERWVLMTAIDEPVVGKGPFTTLLPPGGRFWADPHVVEDGGRHYIFFEDAALETGIGHISVMSDHGDGHFDAPRPVLRKPYHLSYPFVFRWQGDWYLLPESAQNRNVQLYRAVRFPDDWEPVGTLLEDIEAFDSTLVEHRGRWWLFANVREMRGASTWDELHVFHADSPIGAAWRPHRRNPVISDVRRARPAGRFYVEDGRLYRPSQNSSRRYGYALMLNEVIELDENVYRERTVRTVWPREQPRIEAIHSYSRAGRLTVVDAVRREFRAIGQRPRPGPADVR